MTSRRAFLKKTVAGAAALGFPTILPRHVLGGTGHVPPSEKVAVGIVGVGGRGRNLAEELVRMSQVRIVAIADPAVWWDLHAYYYQSFAGRGPVTEMIEQEYADQGRPARVTQYEDFRRMLDAEPGLDAIICATPDHTHAYVVATAMRSGKHVYCEKPLTHNLWENRQLRDIARETGRVTQMGNQGHSRAGIRHTVEYLRSGLIGDVRESHSWSGASRFNKVLTGFPKKGMPQPEGLNWDLWLGPREPVPYHEKFTPVAWRDFWRFGTGALGDFGCHDLDDPVWAFNLAEPQFVEIFPGGFPNGEWDAEVIPYAEIGLFRFQAKGEQQALDMHWYSGGLRPPTPEILPEGFRLPERGVMYVGEKGVIQTDGAGSMPRVFPAPLREEARQIEESIPRSSGHLQEWIDAIQGGPPPGSNFDYATRLNEIVLLGVLSLRLGGARVRWDSRNLRVPGLPEADPIIREAAREGWRI